VAELIAIAGRSCAGKSTIARELARRLGAVVIPLDAYYRDLSHLPPEAREQANFDTPEAIEDALLAADLERLLGGETIERPTYDFTTHTRKKERVRVAPAPYVLVEGLFVWHWEPIRRLCSLRVYVEVEDEIALRRRLERDVRERGRSEASVRRQFEATVRPMAERYVLPLRRSADVVVDGTAPVEENVNRILERLHWKVRRHA